MASWACRRYSNRDKSKMNVLYVTQYFSFKPRHAAAVTTYELVSRLVEKGYGMTVAVPNIDPNEEHNIQTMNSKIQVRALTHFPYTKVQRSTLLRFFTISLWYLFLVVWMLRAAKKERYNVVIAMYHSNHLATASAFIVSIILGLPLIVKEHDLIPEYEDPNTLRRLHTKFTMVINLSILRRCDIILVLGNDRKRMVQKLFAIDERKFVIFPNGVDPQCFKPEAKLNLPSGIPEAELEDCSIILYAGALTENRGLENLIGALPAVIEKRSRTKLVVLGEGPEQRRMISLAELLHLSSNIMFLGSVEHSSVPNFISLADITIGPLKSSIPNSTSLPIKVLEYMACGKPVIACHGGVSSDLIINDYNGMLVHEGNTEELSAAFLKALGDDGFSKKLGHNARRHVLIFHNWDLLVSRLDKVIKELVTQSREEGQ